MNVISNTTVLCNFAAIKQLGLLKQLFGVLFIPTAVYDEIYRGQEEGYEFCQTILLQIHPLNLNGWIHLSNLNNALEFQALTTFPRKIHQGESECLSIAQHRHWLFLTDDGAARHIAKQRQITISGTLGCLVLLVEQAHLSLESANGFLAAMIEQGYRSPLTDLTNLIHP